MELRVPLDCCVRNRDWSHCCYCCSTSV